MGNDVLVIIGEKIRELREEAGLSQKDLAERLGVGQTIVAYWEKGGREIKARTVHDIARLFNTTPNYLMGYEDSMMIAENEVLRFSKIDSEIIREIQKNKEFMKFLKGNTSKKIKTVLKLWKSVEGILDTTDVGKTKDGDSDKELETAEA